MMFTRTLLKFGVLCIGLLISNAALAGFETYTPKWPNDAASVNEKVNDTKSAAGSVTKISTKPGCEEETPLPMVDTSTRIDEMNRLYVKFGGIFTTAEIRGIDNLSVNALSGTYLIDNNINKDYISWEFGLGSRVKLLRWELSYIYNKTLHYDQDPLFAGLVENLSASATNQTLWLGLYWDLNTDKFWYFRPYVGALGGFYWNQTRSTLNGGGVGTGIAQNHSNYGVSWGATIGARIPFWERWFCYFDYKYLNQGHMRFVDSTGFMQLKGNNVLNTFGLGVQYLLG